MRYFCIFLDVISYRPAHIFDLSTATDLPPCKAQGLANVTRRWRADRLRNLIIFDSDTATTLLRLTGAGLANATWSWRGTRSNNFIFLLVSSYLPFAIFNSDTSTPLSSQTQRLANVMRDWRANRLNNFYFCCLKVHIYHQIFVTWTCNFQTQVLVRHAEVKRGRF